MKAIETRYKGILFRSKLEASYAKTFDTLNMQWSYEPNGYDVEGLKYLPDFWLPEIGTVLEVKGPFVPGAEKARGLSIALKTGDESWWYPKILIVIGNEVGALRMTEDNTLIHLSLCEKCNNYWFMPTSGSYACRHCRAHDGDHHIKQTYNHLNLEQIKI